MSLENTHCPVCRKNRFEEYLCKNSIMLFRCKECGFICADTSSVNLNECYNREYLHSTSGVGSYVNYEFDKMPMESTYRNVLSAIMKVRPGRRLLDAGAANGYFVEIANACDYAAEGFDINISASEEASRRGRKVTQGDLFTSDYIDSSFDVITAFDFFEHIPQESIERHIKKMNTLLVPNGILAIITVNTASVLARVIGKHWHTLLPPEHISYFSKDNIKFFLERNGYDVLQASTINKSFSLQYIFNILYKWQKLSLWRRITLFLERHPRLGRFAFKLYIWDNMLVIARKR